MKIHIVQKGDTLWEIAKKYEVDFEALKQANSHLASPDMIMPGMKIRIPTKSKKIATKDKKQSPSKKEVKTQPPVQKQAPMPEKSIELPKMPTFPLEQEELAPLQDKKYKEEKKVKEYPISILPELPETKKEYEKPKQEVKPDMAPPKEAYPTDEQPMFMPPPYPSYPQQHMMPVATYPCPCHGMMPMPPPPPCGCGGMQPQMPYGYYPMPQAMPSFDQTGMHSEMMEPPFGHQGYQHQPSNQPQMYPTNREPELQQESEESQLQMYPKPPLGMRNEKLEISPTPSNMPMNDQKEEDNHQSEE